MSEKKFEVGAAQLRAAELRRSMAGKRYRHRKGGTYRVMWVDVDEATGEPRVSYRSEGLGYVWNRPHANFVELVDGRPRFELIAGPPFAREPGAFGDEPPPEVDIRGGERGKYADRYTSVHVATLGNCAQCGRTLDVRGYKCAAHGMCCAFCVHDWKCPKCGAAVDMVSR